MKSRSFYSLILSSILT